MLSIECKRVIVQLQFRCSICYVKSLENIVLIFCIRVFRLHGLTTKKPFFLSLRSLRLNWLVSIFFMSA